MPVSLDLNYEWTKVFDSVEEAGRVATNFHEALCGNADYQHSNIILSWNGSVVCLTEFEGSNTHVHVAEEGGDYILEIFKR